jgi:tetratricopeptide (TPR) repeat protein
VFGPIDVAVQRAFALAPGLAQAHTQNGFKLFWFDYNWSEAEREFRRALTANPSVALAQNGLAQLLMAQDRSEQGLAHMRLARQLDPMSPLLNGLEASYLIDAGRINEARTRLTRVFEVAPNFWLNHVAQAQLHLTQQQPELGLAALRRAVVLTDGGTQPISLLGMHLARLGQREEAGQILSQLLVRAKMRYVPPTSLAAVYAGLGEIVNALAALEQAYAVRDQRMVFLKDDPRWTGLRTESRFMALMRKLKLDRFGPGLAVL